MSKKILITGKNSYIGLAVKVWLREKKQHFTVDELCLLDDTWQTFDFSQYDAVFHVAGIAHSDTGSADDNTVQLYYRINTQLAISVAEKARRDGVKQFILMSSMIVFGENASLDSSIRITHNTIPKPLNFYGDSKLQAEIGLTELEQENFKVAIIRPPMVYGKNVKGNYPRLSKLAQRLKWFPDVENERSMIHIDNLCEFIYHVIIDQAAGTFHPQNSEYVNVAELVRAIALVHEKNLILKKGITPFLPFLSKFSDSVTKVFGNFSYDMELSEYPTNYRIRSFEESIQLTEK